MLECGAHTYMQKFTYTYKIKKTIFIFYFSTTKNTNQLTSRSNLTRYTPTLVNFIYEWILLLEFQLSKTTRKRKNQGNSIPASQILIWSSWATAKRCRFAVTPSHQWSCEGGCWLLPIINCFQEIQANQPYRVMFIVLLFKGRKWKRFDRQVHRLPCFIPILKKKEILSILEIKIRLIKISPTKISEWKLKDTKPEWTRHKAICL